MKKINVTAFVILLVVVIACSTSKQKQPLSPTSSKQVDSSQNFVMINPPKALYTPGDKELAAIQQRNNTVTMEKLKEGHIIYTQGACINCHGVKNVYSFGEEEWRDIMIDMAQRAKLTDAQREQVFTYVIAMKAGQTK